MKMYEYSCAFYQKSWPFYLNKSPEICFNPINSLAESVQTFFFFDITRLGHSLPAHHCSKVHWHNCPHYQQQHIFTLNLLVCLCLFKSSQPRGPQSDPESISRTNFTLLQSQGNKNISLLAIM